MEKYSETGFRKNKISKYDIKTVSKKINNLIIFSIVGEIGFILTIRKQRLESKCCFIIVILIFIYKRGVSLKCFRRDLLKLTSKSSNRLTLENIALPVFKSFILFIDSEFKAFFICCKSSSFHSL